MRISNELQKGKAGEYLVCADLILQGFVCYPSEQGLPYDVVLDNGERLIKIQVKTTECPREVPQRNKVTKCYIFNIKRRGKNGKKIYSHSEVDIFALVCLDTKAIGYVKNEDMPGTLNLRVDNLRGSYYDEKGVQDFEMVLNMSKHIKNQSEIARRLNMHVATVNRMLKKGYRPHKTNAVYFSEIERNYEWFNQF